MNKMRFLSKITCAVGFSLAMILIISCAMEDDNVHGTLTDNRDGKKYETVKIGEKIWMAENLNYNANGSTCSASCDTYGRLYDWNTAINVCPSGWHLPKDDDWWNLCFSENTNCPFSMPAAFPAQPAGYSSDYGSSFIGVGNYSMWWTATDGITASGVVAQAWYNDNANAAFHYGPFDIRIMMSVRCVKN